MNAEEYFKKAVELHKKGDYEEAKEVYKKVVELDPSRSRVYLLLGNISYYEGKKDECVEYYRKAVEIDPKYAVGYFNLALVLEEKGNLDEAIKNYQKAVEINPKYADAYYHLGNLLKEKRDIEGAIKSFQKAMEIDKSLAAPKEKLEELLEEVQDQVKARETIKIAEDFLKDGDVFEKEGDLDRAIESYKKSIKAHPNLIGYFLLGLALEKKGDLAGATKSYEMIMKIDPKIATKDASSDVIELLGKHMGNLRLVGNDLVRILEDFRGLFEKKPETISMLDYVSKQVLKGPEEYIKIGVEQEQKGNFDEAIDSYKKSIEVAPNLPTSYYLLGLVLEHSGRITEATEAYKKALDIDIGILGPKDSEELSRILSKQIGNVYINQMDPKKVLRDFKDYVGAGKGKPSLENFIRARITGEAEEVIKKGHLLDVGGTVDEAIAKYEKAVEIDPQNLVAHYILGLALESKGELQKAMERYEKTGEIDFAKAPRKVSKEVIEILNSYLGKTTKDGHNVGEILKRYIEIIAENPEKMVRLLGYIEDVKLDAISNIIGSYLKGEVVMEGGGRVIRDEEDFAEDYAERKKMKKAEELSKEKVNLEWKYKTGRTIRCIAMSADGEMVVGGSENGKIYFLDKSGTPVWKVDVDVSIVDIDISPDGGYVAEGLYNGIVELRDKKGKEVWKVDLKESGITSIAVSEKAEYTIVATRNSQLMLINKEGKVIWKRPTRGYCTKVDISADGVNIIACSDTGELYFIRNTGEMFPIIDTMKTKDPIYSVAISQDGKFYAAGSKQGNVYFMDENKKMLWKNETLSHVYGVAVSENGNDIAAGATNGIIYFYNKGGELKWKYPTGINVWDVDISNDGSKVVAGCGLVFGNVYLFSS